MRQKMLDHRVRADCIQCHSLMDPIGFSLENFDGDWRSGGRHDEGAAGRPDRRSCSTARRSTDPRRCGSGCADYSDQFVEVVAEKLLTYALGRGVEYQDMPLVRSIARDAVARRQPLLGARAGRRQEQAVSDEHESRTRPDAEHTPSTAPIGTEKGSQLVMFITKKHIPAPDVPQEAQASRWRCRCSTRWCRRGTLLAQTAATPEAALRRASSSRTGWRPAIGCRQRKARCRRSCPTSWSRSRR